MATATKAVSSKTQSQDEGSRELPPIMPGQTSTVGEHTIVNRGNLPIVVTVGAKGSYRYRVHGENLTGVMRWCGCDGWKWDEMRAVLCLMGLGTAVADNTVGAQISSGTLVRNKGKSNHGPIPELSKEMIASLRAMKAHTADAAEKGRALRKSGAKLQGVNDKGKKTKEVLFAWNSPVVSQFIMSESGSMKRKVSKKPTK